MASYERQSSDGLTWTDQWGYRRGSGRDLESQRASNKDESKLSEYKRKVMAATGTGLDKAKVAATVGAKKVQAGTTSAIRWFKDQYNKRTH